MRARKGRMPVERPEPIRVCNLPLACWTPKVPETHEATLRIGSVQIQRPRQPRYLTEFNWCFGLGGARSLSDSGRYLGTRGGSRVRMPWALLQCRCVGSFVWHLCGIRRRSCFELGGHVRNQHMTVSKCSEIGNFRIAHSGGTVLPHCLVSA